jgi:hypothetical protein
VPPFLVSVQKEHVTLRMLFENFQPYRCKKNTNQRRIMEDEYVNIVHHKHYISAQSGETQIIPYKVLDKISKVTIQL